jgi:streptogramin lyase
MLQHRVLVGAVLTALVALVVACSGGGGSNTLPHSGSTLPQTTGATVKVFIPNSGTASSTRKPAFISPSTATITISVYTVNGATPSPTSAPVSITIASSSDCTTGSSGISCTIAVTVPVATAVVLQISSYDATGNLLGQGLLGPINTTLANIPTQSVSVGGVPATIVLTPSGLSAGDDGAAHAIPFAVSALDAAGNTIIPPGSYPNPIALTISGDTNGALSLSTATIASPGPSNGSSIVTLDYNSALAIAQATITAKSGSISASVPFAPIVFTPTSLPSLLVGGSMQTVTVSEAGYGGAFNVPGSGSVATVTCVPATCTPSSVGGSVTIDVAPGSSAGTESFSVIDANGGFANIPITVTGSGGGGELVAPHYSIFEYSTSGGGKNYGIAVGADGQTLWFVDQSNVEIGAIANPASCTTSTDCNGVSEIQPSVFAQASPPAALESIAAASDGNLYVTDVGNYGSDFGNLFQLTCPSAGSCSGGNAYPYYALEGCDCSAFGATDVLSGPDGNLYVSSSPEGYDSGIVWQPTIGCCGNTFYTINVAASPSNVNMMTFDSSGSTLWYTDQGQPDIGFISGLPCEDICTSYERPTYAAGLGYGPQGDTAHRPPPRTGAQTHAAGAPRRAVTRHRAVENGPGQTTFIGPLQGIVAAPDGNLYVADTGSGSIDQISPTAWETCNGSSCTFTAIGLPNAGAIPMNLTIGRDGNVWFTDSNGAVGFIALNTCTSSGCKIYEYTVGGSPWGITSGPDGDIWFTDSSTNKIGKVVL